MLKLSRRLVVIAVDEMDGLASQPTAVCCHVVMLAETEISEEIQCVIGLHKGIQAIHNHLIHLPRICERAIAISNDVEVSKVKVGRKPSVSHDDDYAGMNHALFVQLYGNYLFALHHNYLFLLCATWTVVTVGDRNAYTHALEREGIGVHIIASADTVPGLLCKRLMMSLSFHR